MSRIGKISFLFLLLVVPLSLLSCSEGGSDVFNLNGRYLLTMVVEDTNCAWDLVSGNMLVEHDLEDIVITLPGDPTPHRGEANPGKGSFTVQYPNNEGGETTMEGSVSGFDSLWGTHHATGKDAGVLNGCWIDATWTAERITPN